MPGATFFSGISMETGHSLISTRKTLKEAEEEGLAYMKAHGCTSLAELRKLPPEELIKDTEFEKRISSLSGSPGWYFPSEVLCRAGEGW